MFGVANDDHNIVKKSSNGVTNEGRLRNKRRENLPASVDGRKKFRHEIPTTLRNALEEACWLLLLSPANGKNICEDTRSTTFLQLQRIDVWVTTTVHNSHDKQTTRVALHAHCTFQSGKRSGWGVASKQLGCQDAETSR